MTQFHCTITEKDKELSVKELLRRNFHFSSRLMTKLKKGELVTVNGVPVRGWMTLAEGDVLTVTLPEETCDFIPEDIPIEVVFEDEHLLVINKQPGHVVHPTKGKPSGTIANGIMKKMLDEGSRYKIRFANRLDMNTSGLLIIAKSGFVQEDLIRQMKRGQVEKRYIAVADGLIKEDEGTIDKPIGRPDPNEVERWILPVEQGGYDSVTHYRVLKRFDAAGAPSASEACCGNCGSYGGSHNLCGRRDSRSQGERQSHSSSQERENRRDFRSNNNYSKNSGYSEDTGTERGKDKEVCTEYGGSRSGSHEHDGGCPDCHDFCEYPDPHGYTLVELRLETGRTHQIRVHLSSVGHPVSGDHLYCHGDPFLYRKLHGDTRDSMSKGAYGEKFREEAETETTAESSASEHEEDIKAKESAAKKTERTKSAEKISYAKAAGEKPEKYSKNLSEGKAENAEPDETATCIGAENTESDEAAAQLKPAPPAENSSNPYINRQALHAYKLSFTHPVSGKRLELKAPMPEDMLKLIKAIEADTDTEV